jgi:hypothetical protein
MLVQAYVRPGSEGLFAPWWQTPDENGDICVHEEEAAGLGIRSQWLRWGARVVIGEGDGKRYSMRCLGT